MQTDGQQGTTFGRWVAGVVRGLQGSSGARAERIVLPPTPPRRRAQKPAGAGLAPRRRPARGPTAFPHSHRLPGAGGTYRPRRFPRTSSHIVDAATNSAPPTPTPLGPGGSLAAAPRPPRQRRPRAFVRPRREQRAPPDEGRPGWDRRLGVLLSLRSYPALPDPEEMSAAGLTSPPASGLSRAAPLAPQAAARPSDPPSGRGLPARRAFASVGARGPRRCARTCRACALCLLA